MKNCNVKYNYNKTSKADLFPLSATRKGSQVYDARLENGSPRIKIFAPQLEKSSYAYESASSGVAE